MAPEQLQGPAGRRAHGYFLVRLRDERWQTARDLKAELVWIAGGGTETGQQLKAVPAGRKLWWPADLLLTAAIAAAGAWMLKSPPDLRVSRTTIALGPEERFANLDTPVVAISPDGSRVVFVASHAGAAAQLFMRSPDALQVEPMAGTEGQPRPSFHPTVNGSPSSPEAG